MKPFLGLGFQASPCLRECAGMKLVQRMRTKNRQFEKRTGGSGKNQVLQWVAGPAWSIKALPHPIRAGQMCSHGLLYLCLAKYLIFALRLECLVKTGVMSTLSCEDDGWFWTYCASCRARYDDHTMIQCTQFADATVHSHSFSHNNRSSSNGYTE